MVFPRVHFQGSKLLESIYQVQVTQLGGTAVTLSHILQEAKGTLLPTAPFYTQAVPY